MSCKVCEAIARCGVPLSTHAMFSCSEHANSYATFYEHTGEVRVCKVIEWPTTQRRPSERKAA